MKFWLAILTLTACSADNPSAPDVVEDAGAQGDAQAALDAEAPSDAKPDVAVDARCASSFGTELTAPFGRLDGTLLAIVSPGNEVCALPNKDHVIVQVSMRGAAYRMVVNVESDRSADPRVFVRSLAHALPEPAFAEGWHKDVKLDYASMLGVHSTDSEWEPQDLQTLVATIENAVTLDQDISVYASTSVVTSAHLIHRNRNGQDGALVLAASSEAPSWLLFRFAEQSF